MYIDFVYSILLQYFIKKKDLRFLNWFIKFQLTVGLFINTRFYIYECSQDVYFFRWKYGEKQEEGECHSNEMFLLK